MSDLMEIVMAEHDKEVAELQKRIEQLEGVRDAAEQIMWCDACEAKCPEQYETLANALAEQENEK